MSSFLNIFLQANVLLLTSIECFELNRFPLSQKPAFVDSVKAKPGKQCESTIFKSLFDNTPSGKYVIQQYNATTDDGYVLLMFRVNLSDSEKAKLPEKDQPNTKKVIQLQHGMMDSADCFFMDEDQSLGFYLVNRGFDVWLGNNRGTKYCLTHVNPNISQKDFFDFSWQEMGLFDLPAFYQKIIGVTGVDKITYFGHSEGTSQMFVGLLDKKTREYLIEHTEKYLAMAPIFYMTHNGSGILQFVSQLMKLETIVGNVANITQVFPSPCSQDEKWTALAQWACDHHKILCSNMIPGLNTDPKYDTMYDNMEKLMKHYPSGTSAGVLVHYSQQIGMSVPDRFQMFDYGWIGNYKHYKSFKPPVYDVNNLAGTQIVQIGAMNDKMGDKADVDIQASKLPADKTSTHFIHGWDHMTFVFARDISPLLKIVDKELGLE